MRLFIFLFILFFSFSFTGCKNRSSDIDGEWRRFDTVWKFENGKAYIGAAEYDFYTNKGRIFLKNKAVEKDIPYLHNGKELMINGSEFIKKAE